MVATRASASSSEARLLSVVVPAYDEAANIRPLAERLFAATRAAGIEAELLIVDDESAGSEATAAAVKQLVAEKYAVRLHARRKAQGRGLSSAVLLGFHEARHPVVLCMDADLQHEPESVPAVSAPVREGAADFAVGSRHVGGGGLGFEWSAVRRAISAGATLLAWPLAPSTDPMSGFFCLSKATLAQGASSGISPIGFKIGLELMVRCRCRRVVDVGITFQERVAGESKLSAKQNLLYLQQLAGLYLFKYGAAAVLATVLLLLAAAGALAHRVLSALHG